MRSKRPVAILVAALVGLVVGYLIWGRSRETAPATEPSTAAALPNRSTPSSTGAESPGRTTPLSAVKPPLPPARPTAQKQSAQSVQNVQSVQSARSADGGLNVPGDSEAAPTSGAPAEPAAWPLAVGAGSIQGRVEFSGEIPPPVRLHREADPYCARTEMFDPAVSVKNGGLSNVWIHVTKGAPYAPAPSTAVAIDQKNCMYVPRVAAAVVGQRIVVKNGDPVLHNVHTFLDGSTLFNKAMTNEKAAPLEQVANQEGVVKWKCDVHPWMRGYVGVSRNGLQAVTGDAGIFRIENVPPGKYTIEAWHEKLGVKSLQLTVEPGRPAEAVFRYAGTQKSL
jgi:plastocyanin